MEAQKQKKVVVWALNDFLVGGAQRLTIDAIRELGDDSYEWHVMTFFEFPERSTMYDQLPEFVHLHRHAFKNSRDIRAWLRVIRDLKSIHADAAVSHAFFANFVLRVLAPVFRYPISIVEQNTHTTKTKFQIFVDKVLSYVTHTIVAVSDEVLRFTAAQERISLKKFKVIRNGANLECARNISSDGDGSIVCAARLVEQKNHALLLEACAIVFANPEFAHCTLKLLGEGKLKESLHDHANKLGISDKVTFAGFVDPYEYYKNASLFASSSFIEGMSLAYIEAAACGLPIVATQTAGTDELVLSNRSGIVLPQGCSAHDFAQAIQTALRQRASLAACARTQAENFSIEKSAQGYRELIADMVKR
jgi:glycosyltransferase involved in cell wall biosynthesis